MSERRTALREADQDDMIMQYDHCCIIHTILHSLLNLVAPCSDTLSNNIRMPEKTVKYRSNGYESVLKNRQLNISRRTEKMLN